MTVDDPLAYHKAEPMTALFGGETFIEHLGQTLGFDSHAGVGDDYFEASSVWIDGHIDGNAAYFATLGRIGCVVEDVIE